MIGGYVDWPVAAGTRVVWSIVEIEYYGLSRRDSEQNKKKKKTKKKNTHTKN